MQMYEMYGNFEGFFLGKKCISVVFVGNMMTPCCWVIKFLSSYMRGSFCKGIFSLGSVDPKFLK